MSETPIVGRLLHAPARLPEHVIQNIPEVAKQYGFPDISDGVRNIGDIEICTRAEESICRTSYVPRLLTLIENSNPMPGGVKNAVKVKVATGTLTPQEHALLAFGMDAHGLRAECMPIVKSNRRFALDSLRFAAKHNLVSLDLHSIGKKKSTGYTVRWRGKTVAKTTGVQHAAVVSELLGFHLDSVPPATPSLFTPILALTRYTQRFGGRMPDSKEPQVIRGELKRRYEQDLEGRIFYPNPAEALTHIYEGGHSHGEWQDIKIKYDGRKIPKYKQPQPKIARCAGMGNFIFNTEGHSYPAAHQAGARLILDYIGATNLDLLR